jgi:hypothetical protein
MSERIKQIYVSAKTKRRLYWISKLINGDISADRKITQDEIADRMISEGIEKAYPNIITLEKRLNALEDQLVCELLENDRKND